MPEHRRKKMMALTTNVLRDDSDKVELVLIFSLFSSLILYSDETPFSSVNSQFHFYFYFQLQAQIYTKYIKSFLAREMIH